MNLKKFFIVIAPIIFLFISACDSTETDNQKSVQSYVFLNIGDMRQIRGEYNGLSYYETDEITGKTKRADSLEVYVMKITNQLYGAVWDEYYFIRDGYYYWTDLDSTSGSEMLFGHPYNEQRLAKVNPTKGDSWHRYPKDTSSFTVEFQDVKTALAGQFFDVCALNLSSPNMTIYYAANYGYIGTAIDSIDEYSITYVKSGEKEKGELVPIDTTSFSKTNKLEINRTRKSFFGRSIK